MCDAERQTGTSRLPHSPAAGDDRTVGNRVRGKPADLHIAFVAHHPSRVDVTLNVVRVHRVGGHPDRIARNRAPLAIVLRHHVLRDHPPRLADVQLVRPASSLDELVATQAPPRDFARTASGTRGWLASAHIKPC